MYPLGNMDTRRACQKKTRNGGGSGIEKRNARDPLLCILEATMEFFKPFLRDIGNLALDFSPRITAPTWMV